MVVDFSSSGDAWYDVEELTKFIAGDNQITEIDERFGEEFAALKQIDVGRGPKPIQFSAKSKSSLG